MSDVAQEISTDYDIDSQPVRDIEDPLGECDQEMIEIESLDQEIDQLMQVTIAIENYGMDPSTFGVLKATNLLSGTSLDVLGMENFANQDADKLESAMATESLIEKIKEKAAAWAAKIIGFTKSSLNAVLGMLTKIKDQIVEKGTALVTATWDAAKSGARVVKAHPYKTVIAAIGTAAAIMGVVALMAAPGTYASVDSLRAFAVKLRDAVANIKPPFNKVKVEMVDGKFFNSAIVVDVANGVETVTSTTAITTTYSQVELGWTQSAVKLALAQFSKLWNTTKAALTAIPGKVVEIAKKINNMGGGDAATSVQNVVAEKTGSPLTGWAANKVVDRIYTTLLFSIVGVVYSLLKDVVLKAYRSVQETFGALKAEPKTT
jgi:ElaB/YqjD/DUF883 family membrane-anchored ribosome-binding protein